LALALALGWSGWRAGQRPDARRVCQAAGIFFAGLLTWLAVAGPMAIRGIAPELWAPPLDRLLGPASVIALGWMWVHLTPPKARRWQAFLAVGFTLTLAAYFVWAPAWAGAWRAEGSAAAETTVVGLRRVWDLWFLALALLVAALVAWPAPRLPRWPLVVTACLALGALLELVAPVAGSYLPVWSRLGLFAAGICGVAVAMRQALQRDDDPVAGLRRQLDAVTERLARLEAGEPVTASAPGEPATSPATVLATQPATDPATVAAEAAWAPSPQAATLESTARLRLTQVLVPDIIEALQAPMDRIQSYRDLLARGSGLREEQVHRYLYRIDANLVRLQVMLDSLVAVLALQDQNPPAMAASIQVAPVLQAASDRAGPELEEKGLKVRLAIEEALQPAAADPRSLARIVDNLLVNASRRSPQGGEVTLRAAPGDDSRLGGGLVISVHDWGARVADTGQGEIDPVSDPAAPVDLKVVRFLAERHGGRLWAEDCPAGTGFFVSLPSLRLG